MSTFRQVCRKNWYIIASTLLLVVTSEILCILMIYNKQYFSPDTFSNCIGIIFFDVALLFAGFLITYFCLDIFKNKYSLIVTFTLIILSFMFRDGEWNLVFNYCSLCLVAVMLSLNFYYVDYCTVSALHTVVYYAISFVLMLLMFYELGFYTVVLINIFLFASHYRLMNKKSVKWVNLIFTGIFSVLLITTFVMRAISNTVLPDYSEIISEHEKIKAFETMRKMLTTTETFGTSEFFSEFVNESYGYNLTKIFGYYGWVPGVTVVILFVVFMASLLFSYRKDKPVNGTVSILITITIIASIATNLGSYTVVDLYIPFVSLFPEGFLNAGLVLGVIFASDKVDFNELIKH